MNSNTHCRNVHFSRDSEILRNKIAHYKLRPSANQLKNEKPLVWGNGSVGKSACFLSMTT